MTKLIFLWNILTSEACLFGSIVTAEFKVFISHRCNFRSPETGLPASFDHLVCLKPKMRRCFPGGQLILWWGGLSIYQESSICTIDLLPSLSFLCLRLGSGAWISSWQVILEIFVMPSLVLTVSAAKLAWFLHYWMIDYLFTQWIYIEQLKDSWHFTGYWVQCIKINPLILASS